MSSISPWPETAVHSELREVFHANSVIPTAKRGGGSIELRGRSLLERGVHVPESSSGRTVIQTIPSKW